MREEFSDFTIDILESHFRKEFMGVWFRDSFSVNRDASMSPVEPVTSICILRVSRDGPRQ